MMSDDDISALVVDNGSGKNLDFAFLWIPTAGALIFYEANSASVFFDLTKANIDDSRVSI